MVLVPGPGSPVDIAMVFASTLTSLASVGDRIFDRLRPVPEIGGAVAAIDDANDDDRLTEALISVHTQWNRRRSVRENLSTMLAFIESRLNNNAPEDDRRLLAENVFDIISRLPPGSAIAQRLTASIVRRLHFDLPHPPSAFIDRPVLRSSIQRPTIMSIPTPWAAEVDSSSTPAVAQAVKEMGTRGQGQGAAARGDPLQLPNYTWRLPDGSYNSLTSPEMGKAGTHYARTVQTRHPVNEFNRPDPGLVFDTLLRRPEGQFTEHPGGLSSLFFAFAALVIHTLFFTSHKDPTINLTNSYVDLSPLYGFSDQDQDAIRRRFHNHDKIKYEHNDTGYGDPAYEKRPLGRGLLHEDSFADPRFHLLPQASAALLVLFCRNHNYIASRLLEVNERGMWTDPLAYPSPPKADSGETADENETKISAALKRQDDEIFNTAKLINVAWFGMVVFSDYVSGILALNRNASSWSLLPFDEMRNPDHTFVNRGEGNACSVEFNHVYRWHATLSKEDEKWTEDLFEQILRGQPPDQITPADFIKAVQNIPSKQINGVNGLKRGQNGRYSDADLAEILHKASEEPAAAFGARSTPAVFRVIEVMGILQSRRWGVCTLNEFREYFGLRRYTSFEEWNPNKIVADSAHRLYGHIDNLELYVGLQAEEAKTPGRGAGLCPGFTISRAILGDAIALTRGDRFFTHDFTPANLTSWGFADCARDTTNAGFGSMLGPLLLRTLPNHFTYNRNEKILTKLEIIGNYNLNRPTSPKPEAIPIVPGKGFFLLFRDVDDGRYHQMAAGKLLQGSGVARAAAWYNENTSRFLRERSYRLIETSTTRQVDIVRDVLNMLPIHWVATEVGGLSLKTNEHPRRRFVESRLQRMLRDVYGYILMETNPAEKLGLASTAISHMSTLLEDIRKNMSGISRTALSVASLVNGALGERPGESVIKFLRSLYEGGNSEDEVINMVLSIVVGCSVEYAQRLINVVDFYLDPLRAEHKTMLSRLACSDKNVDALFEGYVLEALHGRTGDVKIMYEAADVKLPAGGQVYLNLPKANSNTEVFPEPSFVIPTRPRQAYAFLGKGVVAKTMAQVLKSVFALKNLRRAPGVQGTLRRFAINVDGQTHYKYLNKRQILTPWANSMVLEYDE
ncbi:putative linoleate diol synthase [Auriculariales sp. MPI-PUGE-AT-0066]|nr:putative linoleate diol synthase [Auriculariales sp. MPI-PUGE-AT-0066]